MNLLISSSTDPYWNLATEEFLLKNTTEDFVFLYINQPTVVVGKHQNAQKEINSRYIYKNKVLVARRLSGGGTVYHDFGNLNFSFIQSLPHGENISYKLITQSVYNFLKQITSAVILSERNDFMLNGKKLSGSAMHIYKKRILAHGTLLISSNLANMSNALKGNLERYTDKSIASKRAEVMNLSSFDKKINIYNLLQRLIDFIKQENTTTTIFALSESSCGSILELVKNKYSTFDWIYGYSPKYTYRNTISYQKKILEYSLDVEKGIIRNIELRDEIDNYNKFKFNILKGRQHSIYALNEWLNTQDSTIFDKLLLTSLF